MIRDEAIAMGYHYYCMGCSTVYKYIPMEQYEDGHGGRQIDMCKCGSDLFGRLFEID